MFPSPVSGLLSVVIRVIRGYNAFLFRVFGVVRGLNLRASKIVVNRGKSNQPAEGLMDWWIVSAFAKASVDRGLLE
jgi:hypothetical protein